MWSLTIPSSMERSKGFGGKNHHDRPAWSITSARASSDHFWSFLHSFFTHASVDALTLHRCRWVCFPFNLNIWEKSFTATYCCEEVIWYAQGLSVHTQYRWLDHNLVGLAHQPLPYELRGGALAVMPWSPDDARTVTARPAWKSYVISSLSTCT